MPAQDPLDVIRRVRTATNECVVWVSCGKDSVATFLLCLEHFDRVGAVYQYVTPGLSFHEQYLTFLEQLAGPKLVGGRILRRPHWCLAKRFQNAALRPDGLEAERVPKVRIRDAEIAVSKELGIWWHASGQKKIDSLQRRAMLSQCDGVMVKSKRFYPLSEWSHRGVVQFLRNHDVPLSPEYAALGFSYGGGLEGQQLAAIQEHFPDDYAKIVKRFPFAEASLFRYKELGGGVVNKRQA